MEYVLLIGRLVLGGYFLFAGINHLTNTKILSEEAAERGVPQSKTATILSGLVLVLGSLGILFWIAPGLASLSLGAFLVITGIIMHPFWLFINASSEIRMLELRFFWGNMALAGALMILATRTVSHL